MSHSNKQLDLILNTLIDLKEEFTAHKEDFSLLKEGFTSQKEDFSLLKEGLTAQKEDFALLKEGFTAQKEDFTLLKEGFTTQKEDFSLLKEEVTSHRHNFSSFKKDFSSYKNETNNKLDRIESTLSRRENEHPEDILVMLRQISTKLDEPDSKLQALNNRVFKVEAEIELLKQ